MSILKAADKKALAEFDELCKQIERSTPVVPDEPIATKIERITRAKLNYAFMFEYYFPHYAKAPVAPFHVKIWKELKNNPMARVIFEGHRGCAKSTHADIGYPFGLMINDELRCMLLVGQTEQKAKRLLAGIQAELTRNKRIINDFGEQAVFGDWSDGEFTTKKGVTFFAIGMGQAPNGTRKDEFRPDLIVCDDLDNRMLSKNPRRVREMTDYIQEDLMGCFDVGRQRFMFVNSRIAKTSILANLHQKMVLSRKGEDPWFYIQVNALDKKGTPTWPSKYTKAYWAKVKARTTMRAWEANYMNNPIEEGAEFKQDWVRWGKIRKLTEYEELIMYVDPSFKNTATSDFKAAKLWGKIGREFHLIKAFVRQSSFTTLVRWMYDQHECMGNVVVRYFMEANMLQDLLLDEFTAEGDVRGYQLPISPDRRAKRDKYSRIAATAPLYERGWVMYNEAERNDPDMQRALEQLLAFEKGSTAPDDSPDADEGAIYLLTRHNRQNTFTPMYGSNNKPSGY